MFVGHPVIFATFYMLLKSYFLPLATCYLTSYMIIPYTCYLILAICTWYLLIATWYLLVATSYVIIDIWYLLPDTCYLILETCYWEPQTKIIQSQKTDELFWAWLASAPAFFSLYSSHQICYTRCSFDYSKVQEMPP